MYQRAMASGTELRPVVTDEGVRRVLTMTGVGRLVRVYANVAGAMAAARTGPGMSYFDICADSDDRVSDQVASAIRDALAGHLRARSRSSCPVTARARV